MCDAEKLVTQLPWWEREYDHDLIELQHVTVSTTKIVVPWLIDLRARSPASSCKMYADNRYNPGVTDEPESTAWGEEWPCSSKDLTRPSLSKEGFIRQK